VLNSLEDGGAGLAVRPRGLGVAALRALATTAGHDSCYTVEQRSSQVTSRWADHAMGRLSSCKATDRCCWRTRMADTTAWWSGTRSQAAQGTRAGEHAVDAVVFTGNFESEDRQHNLANQLVEQQEIASPSVPARPLAYDDAGNLVGIQIHQSPHITLRYTYDAWNRLVKVQHEIDTGSGLSYSDVAEYEYNAMHWRTVKREGGEERRFYYSASWQLVQEDIDEDYVGSPGVDRYAQQFWGIRSIDDAAARRRVDGQSESLYFHITDG
jgi:YD repeat-containing protein